MEYNEATKTQLQKFIRKRSSDTIATHLRHIFLFANEEKICGFSNRNEIRVWITSQSVIGAFYPVVQVKFNEEQKTIELKTKMNPVGLILTLLINAGIVSVTFIRLFLQDTLTAYNIVPRLIAFLLFIGIFNFPVFMSYKGARDALREEIEEIVIKSHYHK